jgi:hypothetical protein
MDSPDEPSKIVHLVFAFTEFFEVQVISHARKRRQVPFLIFSKVGEYTVKKAQWNFQLENHVIFHLIGIKIVYNVKIIYISADIKLNSIEFTGFNIVHNVI